MPKPTFKVPMFNRSFADELATWKQMDYLMILLNGAGIDSRLQRAGWCSIRCDREIRYLDELTKKEASRLIDELTGEDL